MQREDHDLVGVDDYNPQLKVEYPYKDWNYPCNGPYTVRERGFFVLKGDYAGPTTEDRGILAALLTHGSQGIRMEVYFDVLTVLTVVGKKNDSRLKGLLEQFGELTDGTVITARDRVDAVTKVIALKRSEQDTEKDADAGGGAGKDETDDDK